jgi:glycogen phosphorylase
MDNSKDRVYYLSMEFLIGRSLANNVMNLLLDPTVKRAIKDDNIDWLSLLDEEPDAGLGTADSDAWRPAFSTPWQPCSSRPRATGLRYEYGMFKQTIRNGWQQEQPDNWLRRPDPWEVARPHEKVEVKLNSTIEVRGRPACTRLPDGPPL